MAQHYLNEDYLAAQLEVEMEKYAWGRKQLQESKPFEGLILAVSNISQGMVDGSASKTALRQDTGYMVEKTYPDIAPYLGAFGAFLMLQ